MCLEVIREQSPANRLRRNRFGPNTDGLLHTSVDEDTPKWIRLLVIPLFKGDGPVARSRASRLDRGPSNTRA